MQTVDIPDHIDELPQFLLWETDEVAPLMVIFAIGITTHTLNYMFIPAYIFTKMFQRYKAKHLPGHLSHLAYRFGLFPLNKRFANGAIDEYLV